MTKDEALKLALEALEDLGMKHFESTGEVLYKETFTVIKEALAQPEQEPVAKVVSTAPERIWLDLGFDPSDEDEISFDDLIDATWSHDNATGYGIEYVRADTTPPQRKPLTDEEIRQICVDNWGGYEQARAIEAAHGIKGEA